MTDIEMRMHVGEGRPNLAVSEIERLGRGERSPGRDRGDTAIGNFDVGIDETVVIGRRSQRRVQQRRMDARPSQPRPAPVQTRKDFGAHRSS
jgi:hypothetical protein